MGRNTDTAPHSPGAPWALTLIDLGYYVSRATADFAVVRKPRSAALHVGDDFAPHARVPEARQVKSNTFGGNRLVGLRIEERGNVIRHGDETLNVHQIKGSMIKRPARTVCAWRRSCHAAGCATFTTCTAVTLYSGQLVAQSEFSVVMRFAPDSGKWNVV